MEPASIDSGLRRNDGWGSRNDGWGSRNDGWGSRNDGWGGRNDGWGSRDDGWGAGMTVDVTTRPNPWSAGGQLTKRGTGNAEGQRARHH